MQLTPCQLFQHTACLSGYDLKPTTYPDPTAISKRYNHYTYPDPIAISMKVRVKARTGTLSILDPPTAVTEREREDDLC